MNNQEVLSDVGYEHFAQDIYQTLLDNDDVKPIKVQHNVKLKGKSECTHQIDVYWEYEIAGVLHKVAIECKNYNTSNISIGKIRDFSSVLSDIGNINGIFVCKSGYQSGAKKFADSQGIMLKELREPNDEDWKGRVHTIQIDIVACDIHITKREPKLDYAWIANHRSSFPETLPILITGMPNEIIIEDSKGNRLTDVYEMQKELPHEKLDSAELKSQYDLEYEYHWEDAYIDIGEGRRAKISSWKFTYNFLSDSSQTVLIEGKEMAKAILKDAKTGKIKFFYKDGRISDTSALS